MPRDLANLQACCDVRAGVLLLTSYACSAPPTADPAPPCDTSRRRSRRRRAPRRGPSPMGGRVAAHLLLEERVLSRQALARAKEAGPLLVVASPAFVAKMVVPCHHYSTSPRNRNRADRNHLDQSLLSSQKNRNSLTWVLVALTVCFTYPVLYRVSAESRAGEWEF